jgi:hypothetical protein
VKQSKARLRGGTRGRRRLDVERAEVGEVVGFAADVAEHIGTSPRLTGGDVDADWHGAYANGDEAVGGSTATPDQDVVDELGEALGVPQGLDAEVQTSAGILKARDRHRWHLERDAALREERASEAEEQRDGPHR